MPQPSSPLLCPPVTYINLSKGLDFQRMVSMTHERLTLIKLQREEEEGHIFQPDSCTSQYIWSSPTHLFPPEL